MKRVLGNRFNTPIDEMIHIILVLVALDIYEQQKSSLIDNYGLALVMDAEMKFKTEYKSLADRF